eukprot:COSAG02_NODE_653_length_18827_cov_44.237826_9_plen_846_part_00
MAASALPGGDGGFRHLNVLAGGEAWAAHAGETSSGGWGSMFSAATSWLKTAASGLPFKLGEPIDYEGHPVWTGLRKGTLDGSDIVVFVCEAKAGDARLDLAKRAVQKAQTLRHPTVLSHRSSHESTSSVYLATEPVVPLALSLAAATGDKKSEAIAWGVSQLADALDFLGKTGFVHGNVGAHSIFVTPSGDWKLSGLELLCQVDEIPSHLRPNHAQFDQRYMAPEIQSNEWSHVQPLGTDMWSLACVLFEAFDGNLSSPNDLKRTSSIPPTLLRDYKRLIQQDPARRLAPSKLKEGHFFQDSTTVAVCSFLELLPVKDKDERVEFFSGVAERLSCLPSGCAAHKVLPGLVMAVDQAEPNTAQVFLKPAMKIGKSLGEDGFKQLVLPQLVKWFASPDKSLRSCLLENLGQFIDQIDDDAVSNQVFPTVCANMTDPEPQLRMNSVKTVPVLIEKLTDHQVNHDLANGLTTLLGDRVPALRVNAMICLGMVAEKFSEHTQNRVLIPAFLRGLQDPFVPCRSKALAALSTVIMKHDPAEVGRKVMPTVAPLCCDVDHSVRQNAINCCRKMLDVLTENSDRMHVAEEKAAAEAKVKEEEAAAKAAAAAALNTQPTELETQPQAHVTTNTERETRVAAARNPAPVPAPAPARTDENDGWDLDDDAADEDAARRARIEEQRLRQQKRREDAERRRRERNAGGRGSAARPATAPAKTTGSGTAPAPAPAPAPEPALAPVKRTSIAAMKAKKSLGTKPASANDGWGDDEWGAGSTGAGSTAASALSDAAAKRAALKAKLERKRQLATNQTSLTSSTGSAKSGVRPSTTSNPTRASKPSLKSAASKKGEDDWENW